MAEANWTDTNGREYVDFERSGDTFDCADDEMARLAAARREGRMAPKQSVTPKGRKGSVPVTRRQLDSGHTVYMIEINGRIYAQTWAPGSDLTDDDVRCELRQFGYGRRSRKGFRPYNQSTGCYM